MKELTLQEAFKIIDSKLVNGDSLKNVLSTMAIENMFVSEDFLMELISVEQGEKTSEQLIQETINKHKKIETK